MSLELNESTRSPVARLLLNSSIVPFEFNCLSFATVVHFVAFQKYKDVDFEFAHQFTRSSINYIGDCVKTVKIMTSKSKFTRLMQAGRRRNPGRHAHFIRDWTLDKEYYYVKLANDLKFKQNLNIRKILMNTGTLTIQYTTRIKDEPNLGNILSEIRQQYIDRGINAYYAEELRENLNKI